MDSRSWFLPNPTSPPRPQLLFPFADDHRSMNSHGGQSNDAQYIMDCRSSTTLKVSVSLGKCDPNIILSDHTVMTTVN